MRMLLQYELKKILMKKSTIAVFLVMFVINLVSVGISGSLGSTYVNGEFYETHVERNRIERENGVELSGRKLDDVLLKEMKMAYQKIDWTSSDYKWTDIYKEEVRKYSDIEYRLKMWGLGGNLLGETSTAGIAGASTGGVLYAVREQVQEQMYENYFLSDSEVSYWEEKDFAVEKPFTYQYAAAYESFLNMQGNYMICMLMSFFSAVSMVSIFSDEHVRKTDQLVLSTQFGRKKVYFAKLLAGSFVTFGTALLLLLTAIAGKIYSYGWEGFDAAIQVAVAYWYPYPMTIGQACLISSGLLLLSSVLVSIFTMLLAELLRNSVGAMAIVVGLLFAARLIEVPVAWRALSQIWNYMPINLIKVDQGFTDLRLVSILGQQLTTWQFAPFLYTGLIVALVIAGGRLYRSYQVSGR